MTWAEMLWKRDDELIAMQMRAANEYERLCNVVPTWFPLNREEDVVLPQSTKTISAAYVYSLLDQVGRLLAERRDYAADNPPTRFS